ncbi:16S rRNA (cytidine(1402)-2'-O)-methyltransferase [Paracoccus aminophilus]|nr:16S rRNA (cytidine(1402)-2'-O)-methyltransferase [Paracoccus aminophilus]
MATRPDAGLYLVATPIGTARDITLRALDTLNSADVLAAEDTRTLRHLMEIHGVPLRGRRVIAYHDHNADRQRPLILKLLGEGRSVAYASDAGTPLVADPGFRLARDAAEAGFAVHALPGPSALLAGLTVSGLPSDRFMFVGFPPSAKGARQRWLRSWFGIDATIVLFESPRRVKDLLKEFCEIDPGRSTVVCRELTKKFEEVMRGQASELAEAIPEEGLRGEVVVLFGPPEAQEVDEATIRADLGVALAESSVKDASALVAARYGLPKRDVYALALALMKEKE